MTVLVALMALCVVNIVLIWQVSTLAGKVDEVQEYMRTAVRWLAFREAGRKDGGNDDEDQ